MKKSPLLRKVPLKRSKKPERIPKGATTLERLLGEGMVQRASTFTAKPKPLKSKSTGQMVVFREIWEERSHVSEVSGEPLGDVLQPIFCSHLLPKGTYKKYRLDKRNIVLKTPDEHRLWHQEGPKNLMFVKGWAEICDRYFELLREANNVNQ
jgi:hypothetical protein